MIAVPLVWGAVLLPTLLDCTLAIRNFKYITHKSMLAIIVAHFLYSINKCLLLRYAFTAVFSRAASSMARLSCFLLTVLLRYYYKVCQTHIKSAVNLTRSLLLSVEPNFKANVVMATLCAAISVVVHEISVNLACLAFITRLKTDVFILFYKPDGSPTLLSWCVLGILTLGVMPNVLKHECFLTPAVHQPPSGEPAVRPPFHSFIR